MLNNGQIEYVIDFLAGSGPFGEMLFRHKEGLVFSEAKIFPCAAQDLDFRWGLPPHDEAYNGGWLSFQNEIKSRLNAKGDFCLFRECDAKRHDPCMADEECPMVYAGEDIFYILDETDDDAQIRETIRTANNFLLMGLFRGAKASFNRGDDVSYAQIESFMPFLAGVAVGVFDEEGVCYIPYREPSL